MKSSSDDDKVLKELTYYKKKVDELAGENLKLDYSISGLRHELKQKREGFSLLSDLQQSVKINSTIHQIYENVLESVNSALGMDRSVILCPSENNPNLFSVEHYRGYYNSEDEQLNQALISIPSEVVTLQKPLLVTSKSEKTPEIKALSESLLLPYFVCIGIHSKEGLLAIIISGRIREAKPLYPPLDEGDIDTFSAIAGLIASTIENMKIITLQEMDRLKTKFFANISHEFRTPITLTVGPLESMLSSRFGELPPMIIQQCEIMLRNQKRLLGLINQILDLSKLESGEMALRASRQKNINNFVEQRIAQFVHLAEKKNIALIFEPDVDLNSSEIFVDTDKFDRVIFNLLSNAMKFTEKGFVKVTTEKREQFFVLSVEDSGIGIKEDQITRVFDRFKQTDDGANRKYAGTGIGLALVKEMVELHKGEIGCHSSYGVGTTFSALLPLGSHHLSADSIVIKDEDEELMVHNHEPVAEIFEGVAGPQELAALDIYNEEVERRRNLKRHSILYADDNADLRAFVKSCLEERYNVFLAVNGRDGLAKAKAYQVDLILSDLMMPEMTGDEFFRETRKDTELEQIPFIILTAKSSSVSKIENLDDGVDDYLTKPFAEPELQARIRNLLIIREQQQKIKKDLLAARAIQMSLVGAKQKIYGNHRLEVEYVPCDELSGDFYDHFQRGNWLYFYIADVTSHGTASAQVTYLLKMAFGSLLESNSENDCDLNFLGNGLRRISSTWRANYDIGIQIYKYNLDTGNLEYITSNAPPAIHKSEKGLTCLVLEPGPRVSCNTTFEPGLDFEVGHLQLKPGDELFAFTDGCYEVEKKALPGSMIGQRGFHRLIEKISEPNNWREQLIGMIKDIGKGGCFDDDVTILRLEYLKQAYQKAQ